MPLRSKHAEPEIVVQAITGGVFKIRGTLYRVAQGERIRASHPLAQARPQMFVADGLSDAELASASQRYEQWKAAQR